MQEKKEVPKDLKRLEKSSSDGDVKREEL